VVVVVEVAAIMEEVGVIKVEEVEGLVYVIFLPAQQYHIILHHNGEMALLS
jgi:hypothetical protein